MVTKKSKTKKVTKKPTVTSKVYSCGFSNNCNGGFAYVLGFIGAAIYYVSTSTGILGGIVGVLKALVWPAFLVHGLLKFIGA